MVKAQIKYGNDVKSTPMGVKIEYSTSSGTSFEQIIKIGDLIAKANNPLVVDDKYITEIKINSIGNNNNAFTIDRVTLDEATKPTNLIAKEPLIGIVKNISSPLARDSNFIYTSSNTGVAGAGNLVFESQVYELAEMVYFKEMTKAALKEFVKYISLIPRIDMNNIEGWDINQKDLIINWLLDNEYLGMKETLGVEANSQIIRDSITFKGKNIFSGFELQMDVVENPNGRQSTRVPVSGRFITKNMNVSELTSELTTTATIQAASGLTEEEIKQSFVEQYVVYDAINSGIAKNVNNRIITELDETSFKNSLQDITLTKKENDYEVKMDFSPLTQNDYLTKLTNDTTSYVPPTIGGDLITFNLVVGEIIPPIVNPPIVGGLASGGSPTPDIGLIVGGVFGGIALLGIVGGLAFRQSRKHKKALED